MSAVDSNPEKPSTPTPIEEPSSKPNTRAPAAAKPGRRDLGLDQMCVRVLLFIKRHGGRVTMSQLRRGLNAYRHPQIYEAAIQQLLDVGAVEVARERGSRRQWISLIRIPKRYEAVQRNPRRRRQRPRSRGRTGWFESLMAQRNVAELFALLVRGFREARRESDRRAARTFLANVLAK